MSASTPVALRMLPALSPLRLKGPAAVFVVSLVAAVAFGLFGWWTLVAPIWIAALVLAVLAPARAAALLLFVTIAVEPGAFDFSKPVSDALYNLPPALRDIVPLTISPLETVLVVATIAAVHRYGLRPRPPLFTLAVPAVVTLGAIYGLYKGAPSNLVYSEARGLLMGIAIFVLAVCTLPRDQRSLLRLLIGATVVLATLVLARYMFYVRNGQATVPIEFAFAHESTPLLAIGAIAGGLTLIHHARDAKSVVGLILYCALMVAAIMVTGRRAGTLVLLAGGSTALLLAFPRRRHTVAALILIIGVCGAAYLPVYWNKDSGAIAQPARAIRSQISPSARDDSSDTYREIERLNATGTLQLARVFGVGFGKPFYEFRALPDLTSFWPLQMYTPHQSILWLWLKMGFLGIAICLGFLVLCLQRAARVMRFAAHRDPAWTIAATVFSAIVACIAYATVDQAFASSRQILPIAIASAAILTLPLPWRPASAD